MDKKELRKHFSVLRKSAHNDMNDSIIASRLLEHEKIIIADKVLLYASFRTEVDTWSIAKNLLKKNIQTAFPRCGENGGMTFHIISALNQLTVSAYGICEPDTALPMPEITERTVCIVPGLAFTEQGKRLGYGGGFYDRFLSENVQIYTIALAYEKCIVEDLPTEEHDIKVKSIITEERTIICNE